MSCCKLAANPLARVKLLRVPNVRRVVLDEETFQRFQRAAEPWLRPILLVAFDTGMRKSEVLNLRWSQLDLRAGAVRLEAEDTKTDEPRVVYLTDRVLAALSEIKAAHPERSPAQRGGVEGHADYVFVNPATGKPWQDVQGAVERAREKAGLQGVWVHDLRRSFVTLSRRSGLPESVVARFSSHRTAAVFKRYNIVEEQDLKAAVKVLNRARASTPPALSVAARSAAESKGSARTETESAGDGHDSVTVREE